MEKLKTRKKKLINSIIILNISFLIGTLTITNLSKKIKFVKKDKEKTLQFINFFKEEEDIYLSHLKEIFNFQIIYLINTFENNDSSTLLDLYNNNISNLSISQEKIKSLLKVDFSKELKKLSLRIDKFESISNSSMDIKFLIEYINKINENLINEDFEKSSKLFLDFYEIENPTFLTTSEDRNLKTILDYIQKK